MKTKHLVLSAAALTVLFHQPLSANEQLEAGREVARVHCQACHGENGISTTAIWPNLAGQKQQYLVKQLNDFASRKRNDAVMSPIAERLSAADIAAVAAFYSNL